MSAFGIEFLTRPGCHICDDARPLVEWAARRAGVSLREVDVGSDDELLGLYGLRIPVVLTSSGEVVAEGRIADRRRLFRAVKELSRLAGED